MTTRKYLAPFGWAAASGLMMAGALPHLDWGWLAWAALIPFLRVFPLKNKRTAFVCGMTFGVFYLGVMAYWVGVFAAPIIGPALSILGWALVTAYQAFFLGVWAAGAQWLRSKQNPLAWRMGVPALWAVIEWWRQSGPLGLGWGDLAYTQHFALPILQLTKLTGIWGLAFLIVLVNVSLTEIATGLRKRSNNLYPLATAALIGAALVFGEITIQTEKLRPTFVAAALQGNINQNVNQDPAYVQRVMETYLNLTHTAKARGAILTVWPETAYPGYFTSEAGKGQLAEEARRNHLTMVIGGVEYDPLQHKNSNSLFLLSNQGQITGSYQKRQLVPFGEFVPGRRWMPFLEALHVTVFDMKAGDDRQPLLDAGQEIGKMGTVICFESSYPRLTQEQVARSAGLLVISTDDAWFGRTAAARQHSAMAAVRAAETDRYLVRSAATGISQVVDPTGRVLAEADLYHPAVVSALVQSRSTMTPYVRWGDWFVGFCGLLLAGVSWGGRCCSSVRVHRAETSHSSGR